MALDVVGTGMAPGDAGLEADMNEQRYQNTGVYYVRPTPGGAR